MTCLNQNLDIFWPLLSLVTLLKPQKRCILYSSVQYLIKKLEQTLELILFRRGDKSVTLTEEGKVLFEHAKRIVHSLMMLNSP